MIRSRNADGVATLWPLRSIPGSVQQALAKAGCAPSTWRGAWGYALVVHRADGTAAPQRVQSARTIEHARGAARALFGPDVCPICDPMTAAMVAATDPRAVDIYRAVAMVAADRVVWQRLETIDRVAFPRRSDWFVTKAGDRKRLDAASAEDAAIADLATALAKVRAEWSAAEMRQFWDRIEQVDWATATEAQRDGAWAAAAAMFAQADVRTLVEQWGATIRAQLPAWAEAVRAQAREALFPQIGLELAQADVAAVDAVASQAGLFVRDALGIESQWLTARGKAIVERGLRDGLGRDAIAADLRAAIPEMWAKYGENYSQTVATNAVVRARSVSQAGTYRDAGIERFEIVAMMDERTTEQCRMLNGQIITVASGIAVLTRASAARNVDELRAATPFIRSALTPEGRRVLRTDGGVDLAYVGEDGGYERLVECDALATTASIGFPPYHNKCRTTTVQA